MLREEMYKALLWSIEEIVSDVTDDIVFCNKSFDEISLDYSYAYRRFAEACMDMPLGEVEVELLNRDFYKVIEEVYDMIIVYLEPRDDCEQWNFDFNASALRRRLL